MSERSANRTDIARWLLSGAIVLAAHGGVAAAMVRWNDAEAPADTPAAIVVDLAPMPVAPSEVPSELPPGPEQVEAEAAPEKPVEKVEETPKETQPTEVAQEVQPDIAPAPDPEFALAALPPKPEPEPPTPKDNQAPAPVTTAPQVMPVEPAPVAAAPTQGQLNVTSSIAIPTWRNQVVSTIERNKRYPAAAQARREHGTAQLAFSIDRQGRVLASRIVHSSGSPALDQETLDLLQRAQPFPPPPPDLAGAQIDLTVPIRYNMR
jgi:protein TonB